jgi:hypothetical protein
MAAVFSNFQSGTTTTTPLVIAGTTLDSAGFANLPTIAAPDYMWLTLDPTGVAGLPEIVQVTAHAGAATTLTIVRAQQATVARAHLAATIWRHSATKNDWDTVVALVPAGTIRAGINSAADAGWLLFNQTVASAQTLYPALWAVAPAAWKSGASLVLPNTTDTDLGGAGAIVLGATGGANSKVIGSNNLPTHTHPVTVTETAHSHPLGGYVLLSNTGGNSSITPTGGVGSAVFNGGSITIPNATSTATTGITAAATANTTTATALDVTPLRLAVVYQIKAH